MHSLRAALLFVCGILCLSACSSTGIHPQPKLGEERLPVYTLLPLLPLDLDPSVATWPRLKKGDTVDVIAPSSGGFEASDLLEAESFLRSIGLVPRIPSDLLGGDSPYTANTRDSREKHLVQALLAPDSQAVWAIRGGYGATQLLSRLVDLPKPQSAPKLLIGFSDITALHLWLQDRWGWPTLHAGTLQRVAHSFYPKPVQQALLSTLFSANQTVQISPLVPRNAAARTGRSLRGRILGGNLTVFQASLGTPWQPNTQDTLLFFEEVGERGYRIDRMLVHLQQAGLFDRVQAVILGSFTEGEEKNGASHVEFALHAFAESLAIPVFSCPLFGHGRNNYPLPLGMTAILNVGPHPTLSIPLRAALPASLVEETRER